MELQRGGDRSTRPGAEERNLLEDDRLLRRATTISSWLASVCVAIPIGFTASGVAIAQVTTDGSTGSVGAGPVTGGLDSGGSLVDYHITESHGDRAGGNFLVGLSRFDVGAGEIASLDPLANDPGSGVATRLILARINSADPSLIDGVLRSPVLGADVMLLNASGVIFGAGASLDLGGSFTATSANELRWDDPQGGQAVIPIRSSDPVQLSAAPPSDFGFFDMPAPISLEVGRLEVPATLPGEAPNVLRLVGGSVDVASSTGSRFLRARGGGIEIAAVPAFSVVPIEVDRMAPELFRDAPGATVSLAGDSLQFALDVGSDVSGSQAPGSLVIRGGRVVVDQARLLAENFGALTPVAGAGIDVRGGSVEMTRGALALASNHGAGGGAAVVIGGETVVIDGGAFIEAETSADGPGGSVLVEGLEEGTRAGQVSLAEAALILTEATATGAAGSIAVHSDELALHGLNTGILSGTSASGIGGRVDVRGDTVRLEDGGQIGAVTTGDGDAGGIEIVAGRLIRLEGRQPTRPTALVASSGTVPGAPVGSGRAGSIRLQAPRIELENGAEIVARSLGSGAAGSVALRGIDTLVVRGGDLGASSVGVATRDGLSGDLRVEAREVELRDGGFLTVSTIGSADAGRLVVDTDQLTIAGRDPLARGESGLRAATLSPAPDAGRGGEIEIISAQTVELRGGGEIRATSSGTGDAGNIRLTNVARLDLSEDGGIRTSAVAGQGGDVSITTSDWIQLRSGSEITTSVATGPASGGNVSLDTRALLLEDSRIIADADEGNGGNIGIEALLLVRAGESPDAPGRVSRISASSRLGIDGVVAISRTEADLTGGLAPLAEERIVEDPLRATPCDVLDPKHRRSRLTIQDPDGLPPGPGGWLPSWAGEREGARVPARARVGAECGSAVRSDA